MYYTRIIEQTIILSLRKRSNGGIEMDINCTYGCKYQIDGKCTLTELGSFTQVVNDDVDCIYFFPES